MEPRRRFTSRQTADRVACADEPMGRGGHESGRQVWHPCLQHRLPGPLRQLVVKEGYPIGAAASMAKGLMPARGGDGGMWLRSVLEAVLIPLNPGDHRVGAIQGQQSLGDHGTMIGITTDQIRAGAVYDVQCFVDGRSHDDSPYPYATGTSRAGGSDVPTPRCRCGEGKMGASVAGFRRPVNASGLP